MVENHKKIDDYHGNFLGKPWRHSITDQCVLLGSAPREETVIGEIADSAGVCHQGLGFPMTGAHDERYGWARASRGNSHTQFRRIVATLKRKSETTPAIWYAKYGGTALPTWVY